jgi:hypothetical protein
MGSVPTVLRRLGVVGQTADEFDDGPARLDVGNTDKGPVQLQPVPSGDS